MPFIELPTAPNTSGASIGAALAGVGHDYMDQRIAQDRFNQVRQNQLTDIASQRANAQNVSDRELQNRLTEQNNSTSNAINLNSAQNQALIQRGAIDLLVSHGYLNAQDAGDPVKVSAAFQQSQKDGLYQRYHDMLTSVNPQTGKPFLTPADMSNPQAVDQAFTQFGNFSAGQGMIGLNNAADAKQAATAAQLQLQQIQAQKQNLNQRVQALQASAQPTEQEIQGQALVLASQGLKAGQVPSTAAIAAQRQQAIETVTQTKLQQIAAARAPFDEQRRNLDASENRITQQLNEFAKKNVYPDSSQLSDPDDAAGAPAAAPAALDPRVVGQQALSSLVQSSAPAGGSPAMLADPTGSDPIIAAENQRRQRSAFQTSVATPLQQAQQEAASIDQQLQAAHNPQAPASFSPYAPFQVVNQTASDQAQQISTLLQRKAAVQARISQLQSMAAQQPGIPGGVPTLAGTTPPAPGSAVPQTGAQISAPSLSDINGSTPAGNAGAPSMMDLYGTSSSYLSQ